MNNEQDASDFASSQDAATAAYLDYVAYGEALDGAMNFNMRPRFNTAPSYGRLSCRMIMGPFNNSNPNTNCPATTCYINIYTEEP